MANAKLCDRCNRLYVSPITPDVRINKYVHPYGDSWVDLCPHCQEQLEKWLDEKGKFVEVKDGTT